MPRTIAIGDVHGCAREFEELLKKLKLSKGDRVVQVGDLVNRGPDSHDVIQLAQEYGVESILGNHELRLLRYKHNGRKSQLKEYDRSTLEQLTRSDWDYLEKLPEHRFGPDKNTVFVHGGFLPSEPWQNQNIDTITTIQVIDRSGNPAKRSDAPDGSPWAEKWHGKPFVIYGHTPRPKVLSRPGSIGIDTGCVYGGHLTAYIVESQKLLQVPARKAYAYSKRLPSPV